MEIKMIKLASPPCVTKPSSPGLKPCFIMFYSNPINSSSFHGNSRKPSRGMITWAERQPNGLNESKPFPKKLLVQAAIGLFTLGFIDAGYSGDWSRIGVISKEFEEVLQVATFFVVPLSLGMILYLSYKKNKV